MSRKDYELIAGRIKGTRSTYSSTVAIDIVDDLAMALAESLRDENPRFNTNRFLKACGSLAV